MAKVSFLGESQGTIHLHGDVLGVGEFSWYKDTPCNIVISTGDVFCLQYLPNGWCTWQENTTGLVTAKIKQRDGIAGASLEGEIQWVELWEKWPRTTPECAAKMEVAWEAGLSEAEKSVMWDWLTIHRRLMAGASNV